MKLQLGLTKESIFNEMYLKYPKSMKIFCNWIDEYKKSVAWHSIFFDGIKFHNLPYSIQFGIWIEFLKQYEGKNYLQYYNFLESLECNIRTYFFDKDFQNN